jgi:hypothetical protein
VVRGEAVYYAVILALLLGIRVAWSLRARADVRRRAVRTEA